MNYSGALPLPSREGWGEVRGYALLIGRNPSPGLLRNPTSSSGRGRKQPELQQMHRMRREQADRGKCDAGQRQQARYPRQRDYSGDDGRRSQHDADLERSRGELEVMILCRRKVALFLGMPGALGQLLRPFAGFRLRAVARRGLLPFVDLLLHRRLGGIVAHDAEAQSGLIRRGLNHGAADALGLKERPQVRTFDILADGFGLGALAQRLRQREKQRDHGNQQRDLLVLAGGVLGMLRLLHTFMCAHGSLPLDRPTIDRTTPPAQEASRYDRTVSGSKAERYQARGCAAR